MWRVFVAAIAITAANVETLHAFAGSYDCKHVAHTNVGWDAGKRRYTAEAHEKISNPSVVKLTSVRTDKPMLTGQQVTPLYKLTETQRIIWFAEQTPAGAIIQWTLFDGGATSGANRAALISAKSYDFMGPQSFTDVYECTPNSPLPSER